ncbi:hypothetical protein GCM10010384_59400 [Streptomyces djakartensis]|uniref:Uncharacterized protein n=1 Tax=Streptomyces djakartensis TaxID=68193 RepID=A0ABQ3AF00_9ACTN|nr:hypothetical protein GCM10010384_59400 [Streptomyces djakartensis]
MQHRVNALPDALIRGELACRPDHLPEREAGSKCGHVCTLGPGTDNHAWREFRPVPGDRAERMVPPVARAARGARALVLPQQPRPLSRRRRAADSGQGPPVRALTQGRRVDEVFRLPRPVGLAVRMPMDRRALLHEGPGHLRR